MRRQVPSLGARDVARHGRPRVVGGTGSGVEAPAVMNEPCDEFFRHALVKGVGGGQGVAVAAGRGWLRFAAFRLFFDVVVDVPVAQVVVLVSCPC